MSLLGLASVATSQPTKVWIDTDPAVGAPWREVDDAFALLLAFRSPELEVAGISTSYGNASLDRTTTVANDLVWRFTGRSVPVYSGARSPRDLGRASPATEALANVLRRDAHIAYVALAPLTNLATFATLHPQLLRRIDSVYFVGGQSAPGRLWIGDGRALGIHDTNVFKDPEAASRVLASTLPMTLAPAQLGAELMISGDDLWRLRRCDPAGKFLSTRCAVWLAFWRYIAGQRGGAVFDCLPLLALVQPELIRREMAFARVSGGELLISHAATDYSHQVSVCTAIEAAANAAMVERLTTTRATPASR